MSIPTTSERLAAEAEAELVAIAEAGDRRRAELAEQERTAAARDEQRRQALEADALAELPVSDAEVDADEQVRELEARVADGDEDVTAEQLADVRTAAAGRVRFAKLRARHAERVAHREAAEQDRRDAIEAEVRAREALAPYTPAALVPLYDAAVAALSAYAEAVEQRNGVLSGLIALPPARRHRGAVPGVYGQHAEHLSLDGVTYTRQAVGSHVRRVLGAAGISNHSLQRVDLTRFALDQHDPAIVAEGRAQLAALVPQDGPDGAA